MAYRPLTASHQSTRGFTLVELLVALFIMSLLALMSWRGIDSMARAQESSRERADHVATLQTALAQWQTDLDQMQQTSQTSAIDYDGRVLRITRRYGPTELRIIGWAKRDVDGTTRWLRWQSEAVNNRSELLAAWNQAAQWGQNPLNIDRKHEVVVAAIDDWQIFYFRNDAWSNPQSSADNLPPQPPAPGTSAPAVSALPPPPDGVRLVLQLSAGQAMAGTITRDWAKPVMGGGKS
jgi:general secretion pathway protein J